MYLFFKNPYFQPFCALGNTIALGLICKCHIVYMCHAATLHREERWCFDFVSGRALDNTTDIESLNKLGQLNEVCQEWVKARALRA
jgi:hypothetical protein